MVSGAGFGVGDGDAAGFSAGVADTSTGGDESLDAVLPADSHRIASAAKPAMSATPIPIATHNTFEPSLDSDRGACGAGVDLTTSIGPLEVAYAWAGTFGETKDGLAYIGVHPQYPHAYFALGYGGNGITFSLIAAEIIRGCFLGHANPDAHIFRFGR